ncbi:MAG: hypothetical protein LC732_08435, partial [Acidobacteria bacterium]|nr:hypothetical protein [Acidobacteriota bacterium]
TSLTLAFPKWFISGSLSFPAQIDALLVGLGSDDYDYISTGWNGGSTTVERDPGQVKPLLHITRFRIEDAGTEWRMTFELSGPVPPPTTEYTWQVQLRRTATATPGAIAAGWNEPGYGAYYFFWETGGTEAAAFRQGWLDFLSATARQSGSETFEIEAVMASPLPSAPPGTMKQADFYILLYEDTLRLDDTLLLSLTPQGWSAWIADYVRGDSGLFEIVDAEQLAAPVIDGARIRASVPLRRLPVRNRLRTTLFTRATVGSSIGDVQTSAIDSTAPIELSLSDPPEVVVTSIPEALVQLPDAGGASASFTLTNVGDSATTITLAREGDFFTIDPAVLELGAGASRQVPVTGVARGPGNYEGSVLVSGLGVPEGLRVPVRMLVTAPPSSGEAEAQADENRVDVAAPAEQDLVEASIGFTNVGTGPLTGLVTPDVPWLTVAQPLLTIGVGERVSIPFAIDRRKRSDADDRIGSTIGNLSLQYLSGSGAGAAALLIEALSNGVQVSKTLVTVTDTAKPKTKVGAPPPLGATEIALFVSSLGHVQSPVGTFISDVYMASLTPLTNLSVYYTGAGQALDTSILASFPALSTSRPLAFADLTKTVFEQNDGLGTLQVRGTNVQELRISASVFNKSNAAGTYGSAVPVLRSDRGIAPGEALYIPGLLASSATGRTNLMVQELSDAQLRPCGCGGCRDPASRGRRREGARVCDPRGRSERGHLGGDGLAPGRGIRSGVAADRSDRGETGGREQELLPLDDGAGESVGDAGERGGAVRLECGRCDRADRGAAGARDGRLRRRGRRAVRPDRGPRVFRDRPAGSAGDGDEPYVRDDRRRSEDVRHGRPRGCGGLDEGGIHRADQRLRRRGRRGGGGEDAGDLPDEPRPGGDGREGSDGAGDRALPPSGQHDGDGSRLGLEGVRPRSASVPAPPGRRRPGPRRLPREPQGKPQGPLRGHRSRERRG